MNTPGPRRLYRSANDRWIGGVAAGVADYFDVDPAVVRILWAISVVLTSGLTALVYVIMLVVVPLEPETWPQYSPWQPGADPSGTAAAFASPPGDPGAGPNAPAGTPDASAGGTPGAAPADASNPSAAGPASTGYYAGPDWRAQRRAERWQRRSEGWESRDHGGAIVLGILLIVVGALFAWNQIDPNFDLGRVWPFAIVAIGVLLVATSFGWRRGE